MTIIQIRDFYNKNETAGLRVNPIEIIGAEERSSAGGYTHYAIITAGQIAGLKRRLTNGPRGINVTSVDQYTGNDSSAEVYFDL